MAVRDYKDLIAFQLAEEFKDEVQKIVQNSPAASRNIRFSEQLLDAASSVSKDVAEGFLRYSPATFAQFLDYACASLVEAERWLRDGHQRKYYEQRGCEPAFRLSRRCLAAMIRLKQSQARYLDERSPPPKPTRRRRRRGDRLG
jgi:four helix bundle protein